jgi:hypothetical protein
LFNNYCYDMAKQTNKFQKTVLKIESLLKDEGFEIIESDYLAEKGLNSRREVDVHVIGKISNGRFPVHVAIEARKSTRVQNITWIDSLIGKYKDFQPIIVVAVSDKGFSKDAKGKANLNGIHCYTLKEISEVEWRTLVEKVYLKFIKTDIQLNGASIETDGQLAARNEQLLSAKLKEGIDGRVSTFSEKILQLFKEHSKYKAFEYVDNNASEVFKSPIDYEFPLYASYLCNNTFLTDIDHQEKRVVKITCEMKVRISFLNPDESEFLKYDTFPIQISKYKDDKNKIEYTVTLAKVDGVEKSEIKIMSETKSV